MDLSGIVAEGKGSVMVDGLRLTLRCEERRGEDYWYAYRRVAGKTKKIYIGRDLTGSKVSRAAMLLSEAPATATSEDAEKVLGNAVTQQNSGEAQELAALRGELARLQAERDKLASELGRVRAVLGRYDAEKVMAANGKASPRWDKAVKMLDELMPLPGIKWGEK